MDSLQKVRNFIKVKARLWGSRSFNAGTWKQKSCIGYKMYIDKDTNQRTSIENRLLKSSPILKGIPSQPFYLKYTPINNSPTKYSLRIGLCLQVTQLGFLQSSTNLLFSQLVYLIQTFFKVFFSEEDYFRSSTVE